MRLCIVVTVPDRSAGLERTLAALSSAMGRLAGLEADLVVAAGGEALDPLPVAARFGARLVRVPGPCLPEALRQAARRVVANRRILFVEAGTHPAPEVLLQALTNATPGATRRVVAATPGRFERFRRVYASGIRFLLASSH